MLNVTCAVIRNEEKEVLIVQRGAASDHPDKWEFPGGKIHPGESEEECIIREIREELSMEIVLTGRLPVVEHDYGIKQIRLIPFICDTLDEFPTLSEHIDFRWVAGNDLMSFDYSEADVFVAESYIEKEKPLKVEKIPDASSEFESRRIDTDFQEIVDNMMSNKEAEWIADSAIQNPAIFLKLYEYSFSDNNHLAFRSSWTLSKVCDRFPEMIVPYLPKIVQTLDKIENVSTLRSFLRIISLSDLSVFSTREHGILADFCFNILKSSDSAVAVKAYSMETLYKLAILYPELSNELSSTIMIMIEDASAGVKARGRSILAKLSSH